MTTSQPEIGKAKMDLKRTETVVFSPSDRVAREAAAVTARMDTDPQLGSTSDGKFSPLGTTKTPYRPK